MAAKPALGGKVDAGLLNKLIGEASEAQAKLIVEIKTLRTEAGGKETTLMV